MDSVAFKNEVWDFLRFLHEYTDRTFHSILEQYGLTMMQARILGELTFHDLTIGSLANVWGFFPPTLPSSAKKWNGRACSAASADRRTSAMLLSH